MANANPSPATRFAPGNAGGGRNPAKRKAGEACWNDLLEDWAINGAEAVMRMREENPSAYVQLVASGLPTEKQIDLNVRNHESLSEEQSRLMAEEILERSKRRLAASAGSADSVHDSVSPRLQASPVTP